MYAKIADNSVMQGVQYEGIRNYSYISPEIKPLFDS